MAGRLPFNLPSHNGQNPLHDAQIRAALGLGQVDEALFLQQQRELQRDFQLRQLFLQDQLSHQSQLDSMVVEQRIKQLREQLRDFPELQQHYTQLILQDRLHRGQEESTLFARAQLQKQEELQRQVLAQSKSQSQQQSPTTQQLAAGKMRAQNSPGHKGKQAVPRDIAADSLAGNAIKRSELEKRVFAKPDVGAVAKKRPHSGTEDSESGDADRRKKKKKDKPTKKGIDSIPVMPAGMRKGAYEAKKQPWASKQPARLGVPKETAMKPSVQALLDFATSGEGPTATPKQASAVHGTIADLLQAVDSEQKTDHAASLLTKIKACTHTEWSDNEKEAEEDDDDERNRAFKRGDTIMLPNFTSVLPQLPEEPEIHLSATSPIKKKRKKQKGLLDDDSTCAKASSKGRDENNEVKHSPGQKRPTDALMIEYPYPVDTWWPSVASVRKERKLIGEPYDEDNFDEEEHTFEPGIPFRANIARIKERFAQEVAPGVLEKVPHCRIHRMLMSKKKHSTAPELVHCFQVTELYPNETMVSCSHCGTWRHTACGGHYKPYSVRECIDTPFTAICDRCHAEEKILRDHPVAKKRVDRQRCEQIRRGLATSAAMRQASFSKHGGTYKWPLGSVSATHIGGHTRSVHSRHDKAEKQWLEMAQRLSKSFQRLKDRIKVRTKELERLLVSIEDAEGHTDRHNMMLFLLQDTLKECPSGFEKRRRNIFDPEEDELPNEGMDPSAGEESGSHHSRSEGSHGDNLDIPINEIESTQGEREDAENISFLPQKSSICAKKDCCNKPRFDSVFCSDACGVSCLESDLLRTFHYTSDIHPSLLRS